MIIDPESYKKSRILKKRYTDEFHKIEKKRVEKSGTLDDFLGSLAVGNTLRKEVTDVGNAFEDQKLLAKIGEEGVRIYNQNFSNGGISSVEFIKDINKKFRGQAGEGGPAPVDWGRLGRLSSTKVQVAEICSFMHHAVYVPTKERKVRELKEKRKVAPKQTVEEVKDEKSNKEVTDKRVEKMKALIRSENQTTGQPIDFIKASIRPKSFSETVQNLFDCAHLVKEGYVCMYVCLCSYVCGYTLWN